MQQMTVIWIEAEGGYNSALCLTSTVRGALVWLVYGQWSEMAMEFYFYFITCYIFLICTTKSAYFYYNLFIFGTFIKKHNLLLDLFVGQLWSVQ